jgi:glycerol-3-phosphate acyltransferase PlsY
VNVGRLAWAVGAYLAGTFPSAYLVAWVNRAHEVLEASNRSSGEGDAHVLIKAHLGGGWGALAAILDVAKGLVYALAAEHLGHLPESWLAIVGVLIVVGHSFPFYARAMGGRGLSAAAGVFLALLPVAMVVAGLIIVIGYVLRMTGPASTLGFALAPVVAWVTGQPGPRVAMAAAIFGVIMLRRAEGIQLAAARKGWPRAILLRLVFDADRPQELSPREARETEEAS